MFLLKYIMRPLLYLRYWFHRVTRTGSFGPGRARQVRASSRTRPGTDSRNPVKAGLFRHHVKQFHESSCSVASVAGVVNTLLEIQGRLNSKPVTQLQLLDRVRAAHWKERMGPRGYQGRRGLPLEVLGRVVEASLQVYGITYKSVDIVRARRSAANAPAIRRRLLARLEGCENTGSGIIIAHFDQGSFVPELNIPHISPVGGFDPATRTVTVLDVDPYQPRPYQVSFDTFYSGISTHYQHIFHHFGYGRGGYIYIRLK